MTHAANTDPDETELEDTETEPAGRTIGPVTTATASAAAGVLVVCWVIETTTGIVVPTEVQGAAAVVLVTIAGWLVPPQK